MTHTPGPWEIRKAVNGHTSIYPVGNRERVADVYCPLDAGDSGAGTMTGNARLIAAAPEMRELLSVLLKEGLRDGQGNDWDDDIRALLARIGGAS